MSPDIAASVPVVPRIFVSHSHRDTAFCRPFVAHLRAALGCAGSDHIFYDESSLHVGDEWLDRIQREVVDRPIFLVLLTPNAVESKFVRLETGLALLETVERPESRRLMQVLVEETDVTRLHPALRLYHRADFAHNDYDKAFDELVSRLLQGGTTRDEQMTTPLRAQASSSIARVPRAKSPEDLLASILLAARDLNWMVVLEKAEHLMSMTSAESAPVELYHLLATAYFESHDYLNAKQLLEQALSYYPTDVDWLALAGRACLRLGDWKAAARHLKGALAYTDPPQDRLLILHDLAEALEPLEAWDDLLRQSEKALALAPSEPFWINVRVRALLAVRRQDEALSLLKLVTDRPDATVEQRVEYARLVSMTPNNQEALRTALESAVRSLPPASEEDQPGLNGQTVQPESALDIRLTMPGILPERLVSLGYTACPVLDPDNVPRGYALRPPLCPIDGDQFTLGSDSLRDHDATFDDNPLRTLPMESFAITRYPITVAEYACFVRAGHREPERGWRGVDWRRQLEQPDHPVTCVSWHDAEAFAVWLSAATHQAWRLPAEEQWEMAARWSSVERRSSVYPWGDTFSGARCNSLKSAFGGTSPVGAYPLADPERSGASPYGVEDMAGNVWEWTCSRWKPNRDEMVIRGGSWDNGLHRHLRAAYRGHELADTLRGTIGFRLVHERGALKEYSLRSR